MKPFVIAVAILVAFPGLSAADSTKPWAQGVSQAQQDKANAIFDEGNALFAKQAHAPALEKYKEALKLWDHPLIRFNLAVTLIRLDRPLEAADALEGALRFGDAPFDKQHYEEALNYQSLLKGRVGYIEASCSQAGANVLLDGKPWFSCPGKQKIRVMAGEHALVGELRNYLTSSQRIVVAGGATATDTLKLVPLSDAVILKYPYQRWIPYAITGTGAAIGLGGLFVWLAGRSQMTDFQDNFARDCPTGCAKDLADKPLLRDLRDSAELKGKIGISMMVAGGAVTVGGIVLAIVNRPQRSLPKIEVAPTAGGISASTRWSF
jgi:hypothetical protein